MAKIANRLCSSCQQFDYEFPCFLIVRKSHFFQCLELLFSELVAFVVRCVSTLSVLDENNTSVREFFVCGMPDNFVCQF